MRGGWALPLAKRREAGSSQIVGLLVATLVFAGGSSVLLGFWSSPVQESGSTQHASLDARAANALSLLVDSRGIPENWATTRASADGLTRLGLVQPGSPSAIDAKKFDALNKGQLTGSSADGAVDYPDAVRTLGLNGYSFHLSAYPAFLPNPAGTYGLAGMQDFRVAYVGHYSGPSEQAESVKESNAIAALPVAFQDSLYNPALGDGMRGDKFKDDSQFLRSYLVPLLGSTLATSHNGTGTSPTYTWGELNATELAAATGMSPHGGNDVLATGDGTTMAYSKNANERTVIGIANLTGMNDPAMTFYEYVNGQGTELVPASYADYGVVEASLDGTTWTDLTPTYDTGVDHASVQSTPGAWRLRVADFAHCPQCNGRPVVYVALRWVSNGDSVVGKGWTVDDFRVADAESGVIAFTNGFEGPYYDALVIGSDVSQSAMTPAELKYGIRDYVLAGGKLYVLGGQQNVQWLQPLFNAGIASGAGPAFAPDATNPFLTVPNQLAWQDYGYGGNYWQINNGCTTCFYGIVTGGGAANYVLTANTEHAFGDGLVVLTTWLPWNFPGTEAEKFFANAFVYGKYHYLYLEYGPPVPPHVPVASETRTAIMDRTRDGSGVYTEMRFILYVWQ